MPLTAGRVCPLAYRYRSSAVRAAAVHAARSAYVVGGLYGNTEALDAVLGLADAEQQATGQRPLLVFNGDWNWFNTGHAELLHVNRVIREECEMGRAVATAGNIEMELGAAQASLDRGAASAAPADAGCGCAYPEYVDGGVVARSNQLMERLQRQLCRGDGGEREMAEVGRWLVGLPLFTRLEVGGQRVAVLHGDAQSLAGWSFAAEAMVPPDAALLRALGVWPPADKDGDWEAVQSEVAAGGGEVVGSRGGVEAHASHGGRRGIRGACGGRDRVYAHVPPLRAAVPLDAPRRRRRRRRHRECRRGAARGVGEQRIRGDAKFQWWGGGRA
eukprot:COSAG01_NODE_3564_length_5925_cov_44.939420_2_plen_330_part_00